MKHGRLTLYTLIIFLCYITMGVAQTTTIDWDSDLKRYQSGLESRHIDVYHSISKKDFQDELARISKHAKELSDFEVILELMKLTGRIGDGHTAVSLRNFDTHDFPFQLKHIENQWRVVKIRKPHQQVLSSSLIAIDGVPIQDVAAKISEVAQFIENEHSEVVRTGDYITISELLYGLGITKNKQEAVFTFMDQNQKQVSLRLEASNKEGASQLEAFVELNIAVPQIERPETFLNQPLWYAPIRGTQGVYIQFKGYPSFENMQIFGEELVGYIATHAIKQLVLDLRGNGGGDLYVGVVLAYALNLADSIDWKSGVYLLCDPVTFSAAASNTALFRQLLNAKIVGLPTGSNPTGYQDMDQFELPSSKLVITYSKRLFRLSDTVTQGVQPDVLIPYKWEAYAQGIDNMLEWVISDLSKD